MKNQKLFVRILCVVLSALMVLSILMMVIPVRAVSQSEIDALQEKRQVLEQKLSEQSEVINALNANSALIIDRKAALDLQISLNRENISLMEEQIAAYDQLIREKEDELDLARTAEEEQAALFRSRIRAMEEGGNVSYYSYLFDAENIADLLGRLGDINDIMHYDQQLETELRQARAEVEELKREFEQIQLEQSAVHGELDEKKQQLDAQVKAACSLIANLDSQSKDAAKELAAIEAAENQAYQEEQRALEAYAAEQRAAQLAAQQAAQRAAQQAAAQSASQGSSESTGYAGTYESTYGGASAAATGDFIWPVDSTYITSNYGYRSAPTAGASSYHQAVDIGAPEGSPIYAVADGQVIVASSNGGLGNYVSIAHDGDTSTRYSHMTNYIVEPGQYVTQGQIIGYVGCTGIATGDHLDFAVTQNGESVDPLQFYDTSALVFDPTA